MSRSLSKWLTVVVGCIGLWLSAGVYSTLAQTLTSPLASQATRSMNSKAALERLLNVDPISAEWFAPAFLAQVPVNQVQQIIYNLKAELGKYQSVQADGSDHLVVFERGFVPTQILLNNQGQIAGLLFQPPRLQSQLSDVVAGFKTLPGKVSLLVLEDTTERAALNPTLPLAVGSAFKLAVLKALMLQVHSGQRSWQEVVALQSNWQSLPSGFLQTWPDGSLLTVQSLASLMISQSDNTATDHLIHLMGRAAITPFAPRSQPFLTTREAFILKSFDNQELLKQYRAGNEAKRQQLLTEVAKKPLPPMKNFLEAASPTALDIEWFFTTQELCTLMEQVKDLPLMSINPGVATPKNWERVAFKGGSESGVLNLTTWLKTKQGKQYCVSATWNNNAALEEARFIRLYTSLLEILK